MRIDTMRDFMNRELKPAAAGSDRKKSEPMTGHVDGCLCYGCVRHAFETCQCWGGRND